MAASTYDLIHQFLTEYGGLSSHVQWPPVGKLPCGCPEPTGHESASAVGSIHSPVPGASSHSQQQHTAETKFHTSPFCRVIGSQRKENLLGKCVRNKMQWIHLRDSNPIAHGSHQPTPLQERSTQLPYMLLPPMQWKKDIQVITPHDSSSGCTPCFLLQEGRCRRQIYSDEEDICL